MKITLVRSPGHTLREQLGDTNRTVVCHVMLVMFIPPFIIALAFSQNYFIGWQHPIFVVLVYLTLTLAFIAVMVLKHWKVGERLD